MCKLRIKGRFKNCSFICVHAPTEDKSVEEKDTFYEMLEREYDKCPNNDIKIILGDLNAKIGRQDEWKETVGEQSLHEEFNDNGLRTLDFEISRNMILSSTMFPHKKIHKATWMSPDGVTYNQIDHLLIDRQHRGNIVDVRTYRGANVDSDHFLVLAKLRYRISRYYVRKHLRNSTRYDIEKLKDPKIKNEYVEALSAGLTNIPEREKNEGGWAPCKEIMTEAAKNTVSEKGKRTNKLWYDEECSKITIEKNKAYKDTLNQRTRNSFEKYRELRKREKKIHRSKKKCFME